MLATHLDIDAPAETVWHRLVSFRHWKDWGVSIRSVEADRDEVEVGARGRVMTVVGIRLPFVVTEVRPHASWSWRVAGIPATGHHLESIGPDRCRVGFSVPWLFAPYLFVLNRSLRTLKASVEDGDPSA